MTGRVGNNPSITLGRTGPHTLDDAATAVGVLRGFASTSNQLANKNIFISSPLATSPLSPSSGVALVASSATVGSSQFNPYISCRMEVHLVKGTSLPACDSNGLSDPYIKLSFERQHPIITGKKDDILFKHTSKV